MLSFQHDKDADRLPADRDAHVDPAVIEHCHVYTRITADKNPAEGSVLAAGRSEVRKQYHCPFTTLLKGCHEQ